MSSLFEIRGFFGHHGGEVAFMTLNEGKTANINLYRFFEFPQEVKDALLEYNGPPVVIKTTDGEVTVPSWIVHSFFVENRPTSEVTKFVQIMEDWTGKSLLPSEEDFPFLESFDLTLSFMVEHEKSRLVEKASPYFHSSEDKFSFSTQGIVLDKYPRSSSGEFMGYDLTAKMMKVYPPYFSIEEVD